MVQNRYGAVFFLLLRLYLQNTLDRAPNEDIIWGAIRELAVRDRWLGEKRTTQATQTPEGEVGRTKGKSEELSTTMN